LEVEQWPFFVFDGARDRNRPGLHALLKRNSNGDTPPHFSAVDGTYHGYPVLEILKNGGPIHSHDRHFRFGVSSARVFMACIDVIGEFGFTSDDERLRLGRCVLPFGLNPSSILVEPVPHFVRSSGELVSEPWLRLTVLQCRYVRRLGVMKSRALWMLRADVAGWMKRNANRPRRGSIVERTPIG
jgi:hypothetical protein